ncbi:MAG: ABC transporter ATP-binding protein [Deltaproteobacteria bacterium]|nr:ABC transporter ATP-binding protein [Deltaproteobacteria bacterium]
MSDIRPQTSFSVSPPSDPSSQTSDLGPQTSVSCPPTSSLRSPLPAPCSLPPASSDELWALRGVSFEVNHGEVVGIIGRNGAGKSTLLKILSRITKPSEGYADINGRVGSLLEVGTGFHPELTGRENIYLNGAILGMKKAEIQRKFDEIVAFAEVEKFIDTPVKHYSSGMYVRLAFAVAAHLEPEILLVDEVLAVGDAAFQKKCLGKMGDVAKEGRTVLFVSHNMGSVQNLCQRGVLLECGRIIYSGAQTKAIAQYLSGPMSDRSSLRERLGRRGTGEVRVVDIQIKGCDGNVLNSTVSGQDVDVYLYFEAVPDFRKHNITVGLSIKTQEGISVFLQDTRLTNDRFESLPPSGAFVCRLPRLPLPASTYRLGYTVLAFGGVFSDSMTDAGHFLDEMADAFDLTVVGGDFFGSGVVPPISDGVCLVRGQWRLEPESPGLAALL